MPPLGLILSGSTATASGMPLGALGVLKTAKNPPQTQMFMLFGSLGGSPLPSYAYYRVDLMGMTCPVDPGVDPRAMWLRCGSADGSFTLVPCGRDTL